jgi:hypothetical protein
VLPGLQDPETAVDVAGFLADARQVGVDHESAQHGDAVNRTLAAEDIRLVTAGPLPRRRHGDAALRYAELLRRLAALDVEVLA